MLQGSAQDLTLVLINRLHNFCHCVDSIRTTFWLRGMYRPSVSVASPPYDAFVRDDDFQFCRFGYYGRTRSKLLHSREGEWASNGFLMVRVIRIG